MVEDARSASVRDKAPHVEEGSCILANHSQLIMCIDMTYANYVYSCCIMLLYVIA